MKLRSNDEFECINDGCKFVALDYLTVKYLVALIDEKLETGFVRMAIQVLNVVWMVIADEKSFPKIPKEKSQRIDV